MMSVYILPVRMYTTLSPPEIARDMYRHLSLLGTVFALFIGSACVVDTNEGSAISYQTLSAGEAALVLALVNHPSTTEQLLDDDVRLDRRAAENIIVHRDGADGAYGTADDDQFDDLPELDAIAYVGPTALRLLRDYALAHPVETPELVEGVQFSGYQAAVVIWGVNRATFVELDDDVGLDSRAAENLVAEAPFATVSEMGPVPYVGPSALTKLRAYVDVWALAYDPNPDPSAELGIVSDLDKTVVPPANPDLSTPPYPGVTTLYQILENRNGGKAGDMHYVTARQPEMVTEIPAYLAEHGVPAGPIETGISGLPWVAQPEKIADVSRILDATGEQRFVLFGDSSHRDPEVYKAIVEAYPERIIAGFIHKVNTTVSPNRVEGLHLHESYAEVAAILYGYTVITRDEALCVMQAAQDEGLAITEQQMETLLDDHAP